MDKSKLEEYKKKFEDKAQKQIDSKKEIEEYENTAPYSLKNTESLPIYTGEPQYCISRTLIEVYKTDEENWEQYVPNCGEVQEEEKDSSESEEESEGEDELEEEEDEELKGFKLHQGEILETYYYGSFTELSSEHDYEDMNNTGSIKIPEIIDLERFYKGVRLCLRKTWEAEGETTELDDLVEILKGFITEESFTEGGMNLSISGMSKLLEQNYKFDFHQMKRSEIIREVIKTAGLKPVVNPEGLQDDVIDYTNIKSSGDDDSGSVGGESGDINDFVKKAIKGKKGARAKAEAVHEALREIIRYSYYECSHYSTASECLKNAGQLNCADTSRLTRACMSAAGLEARVVHGPNHFWTEIKIDGGWVASDLTGCSGCQSRRSLGEVWDGLSKDSDCGDNPSC
jgi:hypothetical protein